MYQTKFDRWLKETFIYEHRIKTISLPENLPKNIKVIETTTGQYHYQLSITSSRKADKIIHQLKESGSTFTTEIHERKCLLGPLINNKKHSFSYRIFWWLIYIIIAIVIVTQLHKLTATDLYKELSELIQSQIQR